MSTNPETFSPAQRSAIGSGLTILKECLATLRGLKVDAERLDQIELGIEAMRAATGAEVTPPPRNTLNATLVQMLVLEEELKPSYIRNYGELNDRASSTLEQHVERLTRLTEELIASIEVSRA